MKRKRKGPAVVLSIYNEKGGCGKTTTCLALTHIMAAHGYPVLLIDNDPQLNSSSSTLDYEQPDVGTVGIDEVLREGRPIVQAINPSKFKDIPLHIIPFINRKTTYDESLVSLRDFPQREATLRDALKPVMEDYDFIFIDCPGNFNGYSKNALAVSDYFIVPVEADLSNLQGLDNLMSHADLVQKGFNPKLQLMGVILVKDQNYNIHKEYRDAFAQILKDKFFTITIRHSKDVPESNTQQVPVTAYERSGRPSRDYWALADQIIKRTQPGG